MPDATAKCRIAGMKTFALADFAPEIAGQLRNYGKLMRVDKPVGTWLLMRPTLWALWLAGEGGSFHRANCTTGSGALGAMSYTLP